MIRKNLAGRCGMYCGICEIHRAYKDGGKLRLDVAKKHKCLPGDVRCEGCRAVHIVGWSREENWGKNCVILHCLKEKGLETCQDCKGAAACEKWGAVVEEYSHLGLDLKLNLRRIQELGLEQWLATQDERWRCQQCGTPSVVSADQQRCVRCGTYQL
ncbi:DUF3795 domain-containing protein [candidate division WOR-3 bacterium]|nr:DUF3795 domain-containing protein [candidate division WOR-3 bacterium]